MKTRTNNVPRPLLSFYELARVQQDEVINERGALECDDWKGFVFKGQLYNLDDFVVYTDGSEEKALGWDGGMGQNAFHAVVVKWSGTSFDMVVVGEVFC